MIPPEGRRSRAQGGLRPILLVALLFVLGCLVAACQPVSVPSPEADIRCERFARIDCNLLVGLGVAAVANGRSDEPLIVAVDGACPPNARCVPSSLGGDTAGVVVRWADGMIGWATIDLPPQWPKGEIGRIDTPPGPPPPHLLALVGAGS